MHGDNSRRYSERMTSERDKVVDALLRLLVPCLTNANDLSQNVDGQFFHDPFVTGLRDIDAIALHCSSQQATI